ncbi:MAG: TonB-dependent receptor, partial [Calditrichaeota bacterium]
MKKITISVLLLLVFVAAGNSRTIESTGVLEGDVISSEKNEPVDWTAIIIPELKRWQSTRDGHTFRFSDLPSGEYVLKTYRIGYKENRVTFKIMAGDTTHLILKLTESPLEGEHVTVTANRTENGSPLQNPDILISGKSLRKNLGKTIAETIENQPGIAQRTMGPAPARPIMRGLSGDRLLLLEDGNRTGDLSATSADHAVVIEPMTTESIEIIRGPETLLYGANTLGGVIDVKRNAIPNRLSNRITGSVSLAQESVNKGYSSGFNLMVPIQHFSLHFDGSFRTADDINTPLGTLGNTAIETLNGAAGISLFRSWGHAGVAFSQYTSDYGIPPDPLGGHPSGVDIAMDRRQSVSEVEVESFPGIQSLLLQHNYTRYYHEEIEKSGTIGMEFGVLSHHLSGKAKLQPFAFFKNSTLGFWSEYRDYASGGLSFTPATKEYSTAFFTYHEVELGAYTLNGSLRFDAKKIQPEEERLSRTVGLIRKRNFSGFSAAAAIERTFTDKFKSGLSFMHSFRAPGIEELFSEGPHLAAYSYEVGSADLDAETGN